MAESLRIATDSEVQALQLEHVRELEREMVPGALTAHSAEAYWTYAGRPDGDLILKTIDDALSEEIQRLAAQHE